jgi:Zn ribbon nucleic-acid-binding protein
MTDGTIPLVEAQRRARRRRLADRQCRTCGAVHSLQTVRHPAGRVVVCTHCGDVRVVPRMMRPA